MCKLFRTVGKDNRNMSPWFPRMEYHARMIQEGAERGDTCITYNYNDLFGIVENLHMHPEYDQLVDALGEMYAILDLGTLVEDVTRNLAREKEWMIKEGYRNADDAK